MMQQLERPVHGFRDAMEIEQAEPAMERDRRKIILRENVGKRPEAVALNEVREVHQDARDVRRGERLIMQQVARVR